MDLIKTADGPALLFGAKTGNCTRTAIALEEVGLPYEARAIALAKGEHRGDAFKALNPAGKVPVLVVPGPTPLVLTQSNAILLHLDALRPGRLLPEEQPGRAVAMERFFYFVTDALAPSHAGFRLRTLDDPTARGALDAAAIDALLFAERFLSDDFMAGEKFSLADIVAGTLAANYREAIDWPRQPALARWFEAFMARPGVERGMKAFG